MKCIVYYWIAGRLHNLRGRITMDWLADRLVVKALILASHMTGAQQIYVGSFYQGKEALREPFARAFATKGE